MHISLPLKVHYYGTPVVIISSLNPDGSTNIAPMSSAWWLGEHAMLGLAKSSRTTKNMLRTRSCVLNLAPSALVANVDRLALLTGDPELSEHKRQTGYRYEPQKFAAAGLHSMPSELVPAHRVVECPIQLECELVDVHDVGTAHAIHVRVVRTHVEESMVIPGTSYIDPLRWDPLIMKFCDFFGDGQPLGVSRLAEGWAMPGRVTS